MIQKAIALVLFAIVMSGVWYAAHWFFHAIPFSLAMLFLGLMLGLSAGYLYGFKDGKRIAARSAKASESNAYSLD